jgi:ornithine carbamoyltransferase
MTHKNNINSDNVNKKNCISLFEYSEDEIHALLDTAISLKHNRGLAGNQTMLNKTGVLIFEKPSLRTHISFETAIYELGGHAIVLHGNMVQMGKRETVRDVAKNLERIVHLIIARTYKHETIEELTRHGSIPVINALSDKAHPCQALAFALTLKEHRSGLKKMKIVFIGDGNNVCNSLMVISAKLGYDFVAVCPNGFAPEKNILSACMQIAAKNGCTVETTPDLYKSISDASVIYTDVWTSMGQEDEAETRKKHFTEYQVNEALLKRAPSDVLVSHCLPAHRGEEITSDVLDSEHSIAFDEAENRLHVQKAVIVNLFS